MGWSISIHLITMDKMKQQYWIQFLLNRMWTKQDFSSGRSVFLSIWSGARHETSLEVILYHNKRDAPLNMPQKKSWRMCPRSDYWRLTFLYKTFITCSWSFGKKRLCWWFFVPENKKNLQAQMKLKAHCRKS